MNRKKILIVDDDPAIREILCSQLGRLHFQTVAAADGKEGVELFKTEKPDLVLMDMMMPVVSGYEAVTELKADASTRDITIVGLSAKAMATDMERATDVGIDGYITKPFRIAQVLSVVESYLQK